MKKQFFLFSFIILLFSIGFTSCSDDDNKSKYEFNGVCKHEVNIKGYADQSDIKVDSKATIEQIMITNEQYVTPITAGIFNKVDEGKTYFRITNLEEGMVIKNLRLKINGITYVFRENISSNNANLYTNDTSGYFERVFESMIKRRGLEITLTYDLNNDIVPTANVNFEMSFSGRFTYWK